MEEGGFEGEGGKRVQKWSRRCHPGRFESGRHRVINTPHRSTHARRQSNSSSVPLAMPLPEATTATVTVAIVAPTHLYPPTHTTRTTHHAPRTTHHAPRTPHHAPRTTHHAPRTTHHDTTLRPVVNEQGVRAEATRGRVSPAEQRQPKECPRAGGSVRAHAAPGGGRAHSAGPANGVLATVRPRLHRRGLRR